MELPDIGMEPYYDDGLRRIYHGDARSLVPLFGRVFSACVTDPPYELGFMGKSWDSAGVSFSLVTWELIRMSCLPGSPLLAFGGSRTQHRIACAIEDAGWELRDTLMWVYGSGFPKSLDIGKSVDKAYGHGNQRIGVGLRETATALGSGLRNRFPKCGKPFFSGNPCDCPRPELMSTAGKSWSGYGTTLKPAYEPIILAMNLLDGTFASNAMKYGVTGLNIDECRVQFMSDDDRERSSVPQPKFGSPTGRIYNFKTGEGRNGDMYNPSKGRFPANFLHDGSDEVLELFPDTTVCGGDKRTTHNTGMFGIGTPGHTYRLDDNGNRTAARFFYCAKASRRERDRGCEAAAISDSKLPRGNNHPTVKPLALMEYLCRLVKMPEYNLILDPFCGSGTTLLACGALGIRSIGVDSDEHSCEIAANRCADDMATRLRGEVAR